MGVCIPKPNHCCFKPNARAPPCFPLLAHLRCTPVPCSPLPPSCWSPTQASPHLPWASAGSPAPVSAPLRATNPSSLTLLRLSSPPSTGEQSYRRLAAQPQAGAAAASLLCDAHTCSCRHTCASSPFLLLLSSPGALTSLSPPSLPGPSAADPHAPAASLPASRPSSAADCGLQGGPGRAGARGRQEDQAMARWK